MSKNSVAIINGKKVEVGPRWLVLKNIDTEITFRDEKTNKGIFIPKQYANRMTNMRFATKVMFAQVVAVHPDADCKGLDVHVGDIVFLMSANVLLLASAEEMPEEDRHDYLISPTDGIMGKLELEIDM